MEQPSNNTPDAMTMGAFAFAVTLGAGNFIGVRFSNRELEPFWGAGLRFSLAALLFIGIAFSLRLRWPRGRLLRQTVFFGALSFALFYALMYWALVQVTAGVATVVMAMVPLLTLVLAAAQGLERLGARAMVGAGLALVGIGWMTFGPQPVGIPLGALLAMIAAAATVGQSVILGKRIAANHPVVTNAVAMTTGALLLLGLSAIARESWVLPSQPEVRWALAYLVTLGSVGLFVLVLLVVRRWTASATSYMFVLFPVVTMVMGAMLGDERITFQAVTGALAVMAGVWFGALSPSARRASASMSPATEST